MDLAGCVTHPHRSYRVVQDELDEVQGPSPFTRTLIWSVEQLDKPVWKDSFTSSEESIDHNL